MREEEVREERGKMLPMKVTYVMDLLTWLSLRKLRSQLTLSIHIAESSHLQSIPLSVPRGVIQGRSLHGAMASAINL